MKMPIAVRNTVREPKRSATQPQIGMKTPRPMTYAVTASLRVMGSWPRSRARTGSDVTMTVPSTFSMNIAHATISGTMKVPKARGIGMTAGCKAAGVKRQLSHCNDNRCC
jgi:hypothetical protein